MGSTNFYFTSAAWFVVDRYWVFTMLWYYLGENVQSVLHLPQFEFKKKGMCDQFLHLKFLWKLQGVRDRSLAIFVFLLVCIDIALLLI